MAKLYDIARGKIGCLPQTGYLINVRYLQHPVDEGLICRCFYQGDLINW